MTTAQSAHNPASPSTQNVEHQHSFVRRRHLELDGRRITIFDLPRVDAHSLKELGQILADQDCDAVAVELDEQSRVWLDQREDPEALNLFDILRNGESARLGAYLAMRIFQKRFGSFEGCEPGADIEVAREVADRRHIDVHLVDRDVDATGLRAWRTASRWQRLRMAASFVAGPFRRTRPRPSTEDPDKVAADLIDFGDSMPAAYRSFVDERTRYLADSIAAIDADHIAVVLSTAQADAVYQRLSDTKGEPNDTGELEYIAPKSLASKLIPWLIFALFFGLFAAGFILGDTETLTNMAGTWALINIAGTALATAAALAHPITIIAAALSSPLVSLNPATGAGFVGALVQAFVAPPALAEVERLGDDIRRLRGWWQNRLARIALVFVFANLGSSIATVAALAFLPGMVG